MWNARAKKFLSELNPIANSEGLKIIEMDLPTGPNTVFRIYVDSLDETKSVTIDNCASLSRLLSSYLDTDDTFYYAFHLEVSSPGLDRPLRIWEDLPKFIGKKVKVMMKESVNNRRKAKGVLKEVFSEEEKLIILLDSNEELPIKRDNIRKMNIIWEMEK